MELDVHLYTCYKTIVDLNLEIFKWYYWHLYYSETNSLLLSFRKVTRLIALRILTDSPVIGANRWKMRA